MREALLSISDRRVDRDELVEEGDLLWRFTLKGVVSAQDQRVSGLDKWQRAADGIHNAVGPRLQHEVVTMIDHCCDGSGILRPDNDYDTFGLPRVHRMIDGVLDQRAAVDK